MRRYAALALFAVASFTVFVVGASGAVSANSQKFGGTNGRVDAIIKVGNVIYVGGKFTQVQNQSGDAFPRRNVAAFNMSGGVTAWNPNANGEVHALASNGKRIFVGGSFTTIRGGAAKGIAAVSLAIGGRLWGGGAGNTVRAVKLDHSRLLIGGDFRKVQGKKRFRLASLSPKTGVLGKWNPKADRSVTAIAVGPSRVYVGGNFTQINGKNEKHLAALNRVTGAPVPFPHPSFPVVTLALSGKLYVGGSGSGGWLSAYQTNGHRVWQVHTDGGFAAIVVTAHQVIAGGHFNTWCKGTTPHCGTPVVRHHLLAVNSAGSVTGWAPDVNSVLGVFALRAASGKVWAGGDFTKINGATRNHLARFTYN
jgi:Domain of unknown function (DUF5122) beta-propeller